MQSTSIVTCENPRREPNVLMIALSHFKNIIRVQTLLHPVPSTTSIDYSSSTSTSKLCAWLFASSGSRTMMEYYYSGGVLQYASGHLTPTELLHVHRVLEGERAANESFS